MDERHFLRHYADMDGIAPKILVGIDAQPVVAVSNQHNVTLEAGIRNGNRGRSGVGSIRVIAPGAAAMNTGVAALPRRCSVGRREVETDAGRHGVELTAGVGAE